MTSKKFVRFLGAALALVMLVQTMPISALAAEVGWAQGPVDELNETYGALFTADRTPVTVSQAKAIIKKITGLDIKGSLNGIPEDQIFTSGSGYFTRKDLAVLIYALLQLPPGGEPSFPDCAGLSRLQKDAIAALQAFGIFNGGFADPATQPELDPETLYFFPEDIVGNADFAVTIYRILAYIDEYVGTINVPEESGKTSVVIWGETMPGYGVEVYDNGAFSARTTASSAGRWQLEIELKSPGEESYHEIYAVLTSLKGEKTETERKTLHYFANSPVLSRMTMTYGSQTVELDFIHQSATPQYTYELSRLLPFTFTAEFTEDTDVFDLGEVYIVTRNVSGALTYIPAGYDAEKKLWVATYTYDSEAKTAPVAVGAGYSKDGSSVGLGALPLLRTHSPEDEQRLMDEANAVVSQLYLTGSEMSGIPATDALIEQEADRLLRDADFFEVTEKLDGLAAGIDESIRIVADIPGEGPEPETTFEITDWYPAWVASLDGRSFEDIQSEILGDYQDAFDCYEQAEPVPDLSGLPRQMGYGVDSGAGKTTVNLGDATATLTNSGTTGYTEASAQAAGFSAYPLPDGGSLYVKADGTSVTTLDLANNRSQTLTLSRPGGGAVSSADPEKAFETASFHADQAYNNLNVFLEKYALDLSGIGDDLIEIALQKSLDIARDKRMDAVLKKTGFKNYLIKKYGSLDAVTVRAIGEEARLAKEVLVNASKNLKGWQAIKAVKGPIVGVIGIIGQVGDYLDKRKQIAEMKEMIAQRCGNCPNVDSGEVIARNFPRLNAALDSYVDGYYILILASFFSTLDFEPRTSILLAVSLIAYSLALDHQFNEALERVRADVAASCKCGDTPRDPTVVGMQGVIMKADPSGYVYEAVASNRIKGATATAYYRQNAAESPVMWDATDYDQKNPFVTDSQGRYAWDVPPGLWQVRVALAGYEPAQSEWLPVPPPQTQVNIGLVSKAAPSVRSVSGETGAILIRFTKYMDTASLTSDRFKLEGYAGGIDVSFADAEASPGNPTAIYASSLLIKPKSGSFKASDTYTLTVAPEAASYAGTPMGRPYSAKVTIKSGLQSLSAPASVTLGYGGTATVKVALSPASSAKAVRITATSAQERLVSVTPEATTGADGTATFTVRGNLSGETQVTFSAEGTLLRKDVSVRVEAPVKKSFTPADRFTDVRDADWFYHNVSFVVSTGLFGGTTPTSFSPNTAITRGMLVTVLGRLYEQSVIGAVINPSAKSMSSFSDVSPNQYYAKYIAWAAENNIVTGMGGGLYMPESAVTRQQVAAILYRYAKYLGKSSLPGGAGSVSFADQKSIESWAAEGARFCSVNSIIGGRPGGLFDPNGPTTRAEAAAMLQRLTQAVLK